MGAEYNLRLILRIRIQPAFIGLCSSVRDYFPVRPPQARRSLGSSGRCSPSSAVAGAPRGIRGASARHGRRSRRPVTPGPPLRRRRAGGRYVSDAALPVTAERGDLALPTIDAIGRGFDFKTARAKELIRLQSSQKSRQGLCRLSLRQGRQRQDRPRVRAWLASKRMFSKSPDA